MDIDRKKEHLNRVKEMRIQEIENYQSNIESYNMALEEFELLDQETKEKMKMFREYLEGLLVTENFELQKVKIYLKVVMKQLEKLEC
jgi:hypothetical protein